MIKQAIDGIRRFARVESGVVLAETLLMVPVMTLFTIGILEFGNMMWQRQQLQVGVRDAARYWSRCRPNAGGSAYMPCDEWKAKLIAWRGDPAGAGSERVPGWQDDPNSVTLFPAAADLPSNPSPSDVVRVTGSTPYATSPLFRFVLNYRPTIEYTVEMRYIGW